MIDWRGLGAGALWILGAALALAGLSYAAWEAAERGDKLAARLNRPGIQTTLAVGGILFCLGMAAAGKGWVQAGLWLALACGLAVQRWILYRRPEN